MDERPHLVVIGGGLAGLSAGCYAQASGFRTTIVELGAELGGVCTSWRRGPYVIDGSIRWLTGGPFVPIYAELGIVPRVALRTLDELATYRSAAGDWAIPIGRELNRLRDALSALAPEDAGEIAQLIATARRMVALDPGIDRPRELTTLRHTLADMLSGGRLGSDAQHLQKPLSAYAAEHLRSVPLRRLLTRLLPEDSSALFLALMLGYLERGDLSRPVGGSGALRDAVVDAYRELGGAVALGARAEEIVVERGRARSVRLSDGALIPADHVICTSSMPETILRLLRGQYGLAQHSKEIEASRLHGPLMLFSLGVARPLTDRPSVFIVDDVPAFRAGGRLQDHLSLRIFNDEPACAPAGGTVVQTMLTTDRRHWALRRAHYDVAKEELSDAVQQAITSQLPEVDGAVALRDVATPVTYWRSARCWRGAYEGWAGQGESLFGQVDKAIAGLQNVYLAGQWIEPGGGVPVALLSGKQAAQLLCARAGRPFVAGLS